MAEGVKVIIEDLATGETEEKVVRNDYLLITVGNRYVAGEQHYANGTAMLTIKVDRGGPGS